MKKIVYGIFATVTGLVLLFSYRTSLDAIAPVAASPQAITPAASAPPTSTSTSKSGSSGSTNSGLADGTFTGQKVSTEYGPIQVQITVSAGHITDVQVPEYPMDSGRDREINQIAIPRLVTETTEAQNAQISMVSGASYTSDGYVQSLQSALDEATS